MELKVNGSSYKCFHTGRRVLTLKKLELAYDVSQAVAFLHESNVGRRYVSTYTNAAVKLEFLSS
jgi:hypothetical protein